MPVTLNNTVLRGTSLSTFSPAQLFNSGEQGVWYDPSDLTTMFTDTAGTTPVTGVEQTVALMLDKSKKGVGSNGFKRVNLLTYTEQFDNAAWSKNAILAFGSGSVANTTATLDPIGTNTADFIVPNTTNTSHSVSQSTSFIGVGTFSFYAKAGGYNYVGVASIPNNYVYFDLTNGNMSTLGTGWGSATCTAVAGAPGWYRCTVTNSSSQTWTSVVIYPMNAWRSDGNSGSSFTGDGVSGIYVWGADLRASTNTSVTPSYQKIVADWPSTIAGNHAVQSTSGNRPTLSARYNLLTYTEDFRDTTAAGSTRPWFLVNATVSINASTVPNGTLTANKLVETSVNGKHYVGQQVWPAGTYRYFVLAKAAERFRIRLFNDWGSGGWVDFNLSSGTYTEALGAVGSMVPLGNGWYACVATLITTANTSISIGILDDSGNQSYTGDTTKGVYIWGADLRVVNDGVGLPNYQRVNTSTDYDTTNFPYYLSFNGTSTVMSSSVIDLSSTDKATVFTSLRKQSDASAQCLLDFGPSWNTKTGSFGVYAPSYITGSLPALKYAVALKGSTGTRQTEYATYTAPISNVLTISFNIGAAAASEIAFRANSLDVTAGSSSGDAGGGNFGSTYSLQIGQIGTDATTFFNGRLYGLIVRGAASGSGEISNTESWLNARARAY